MKNREEFQYLSFYQRRWFYNNHFENFYSSVFEIFPIIENQNYIIKSNNFGKFLSNIIQKRQTKIGPH
jgi:hypothetical protein